MASQSNFRIELTAMNIAASLQGYYPAYREGREGKPLTADCDDGAPGIVDA